MLESTDIGKPQIVCVLGMHRSGTSLLTRVLNLIGVNLGPGQLLLQAGQGQPKGYWENEQFVYLNEDILARYGGTWDEPPIFPPGWATSPLIDDLKKRGGKLIQETFANTEMWGWKDPRNCLTLPFWQQLIPEMRYVVCLRKPVDVAHSLARRNNFSEEKSSRLWISYSKSAMENSAGKPRLIIFYEDLMNDWPSELRRLTDFLGKPELGEQAEVKNAVQEFIERDLHHHRSSLVEMVLNPRIAHSAKTLYIAQRISLFWSRKKSLNKVRSTC
jgi:hypothetical protein